MPSHCCLMANWFLVDTARASAATSEISSLNILVSKIAQGPSFSVLAELHLTDRRPASAASQAEQALAEMRGIGGDWRRANVLTVLGRALMAIGHTDRAQVCWYEALAAFEELGSPEAAEVRSLMNPTAVA